MSVRALDHLVLPYDDLEDAARHFAAAGFTVGRRNQHPWGTQNHVIQLPGVFLEPIAASPGAIPPAPLEDAFPFAGFLAGLGHSRHPSGMLVLRSDDARADAEAFREAGIGTGRVLHFSRAGMAPDGTTRTVAFTLAFAEAPGMPDVGVFVCQQHHPENFWNPAMQQHRNGATGIAEVVLAAPDPAGLAGFFARFAGQHESRMIGEALCLDLSGGTALRVEPGRSALRSIGFRGAPGDDVQVGAVHLRFGLR